MVAPSRHSHDTVAAISRDCMSPRVVPPESPPIYLEDQRHRIIMTDAFPAATQRLNEFARLIPGWDTYDAQPIAAAAIYEARKLLAAIAVRFAHRNGDAAPFFVAPLPYGGVQLEWRHLGRDVEAEIGPDGSFSYLIASGEGMSRLFDERDTASAEEVIDLIVHLYD